MKEPVLTRALPSDSDRVAIFYRTVAGQEWSFLYPHTPEEDLEFFRHQVFALCTVWLAHLQGDLVGFCAARRGWIEHLFVRHDHQGEGIGRTLLARALTGRRQVRLWTFQRNLRSRRFYAQCGFVEVRVTDGQDNEEKEPDVLLEWRRPPVQKGAATPSPAASARS